MRAKAHGSAPSTTVSRQQQLLFLEPVLSKPHLTPKAGMEMAAERGVACRQPEGGAADSWEGDQEPLQKETGGDGSYLR